MTKRGQTKSTKTHSDDKAESSDQAGEADSSISKADAVLAPIDQFELITSRSSEAIVVASADGKHLFANEAAAKLTGYSVEELLHSVDHKKLLAPEEFEKIDGMLQDRLTGKALTGTTETTIIHKNGKRIPIVVSEAKVEWQEQPAVIVVGQTAPDFDRLQEKLSVAEARLRAAMDGAPFEVWIRNEDGVCILQNEFSRRLRGNLIGANVDHPNVDRATAKAWQTINARVLDGEVVDEELSVATTDGDLITRNIVAPVIDNDEIKGILGFTIDISKQKHIEEELKRTQHELEARVIERTEEVRRKSIALQELIAHLEQERDEIKKQISENIDQSIRPALQRLKSNCPESMIPELNKLESNFLEIASPFLSRLEKIGARLSPRELEICQMIKAGLTTKEIAGSLNTAEETVFKQRKNIRKKLKLPNRVNLVTYLRSIDFGENLKS